MQHDPRLTDYLAYRTDEVNSAALYHALMAIEKKPALKEVYRRMAEAEARHARLWEEKMQLAGLSIPAAHLTWRTRSLIALARRFGPRFILPTITAAEQRDSGRYDSLTAATGRGLAQEERAHARLLNGITDSLHGGLAGPSIAQLEGRHRAAGGNALRAAVLGANDGLVSNLSLVMGVAGAELNNKGILTTGLAGLIAGACSMALGEWLSVQSARELYQRQIGIERAEIAQAPAEEAEELALIYEAKGLVPAQARALAEKIISEPATALDTLAREELGIDPEELGGSAWVAAGTSFALFAVGAIIPVIPFFFLSGLAAVAVSLSLGALALFGIGALITLLTGQNALRAGLRQIAIGLIAAAVTFGIGRLVGASLG